MKRLLFSFAIVLFAGLAFGQQEELYTQFMYNKLLLNPAYAGVPGRHNLTAIGKGQWIGLDGAPNTQIVSFNTAFLGNRVGLGASLGRQEIGPQSTYTADLSYAYHIPLGPGFLSLGLSTSIRFMRIKFDEFVGSQPVEEDGSVPLDRQTKVVPNFGAGAYYYLENWYVGFSMPRLVESSVSFAQQGEGLARERRHYYLMTGASLTLSDVVTLEPNVMFRYVDRAPFGTDINLNAWFIERLLVGATMRAGGGERKNFVESLNVILGTRINYDWFFALSYDISFSDLKSNHGGSIEAVLSWSFGKDYEGDAYVNPRFY